MNKQPPGTKQEQGTQMQNKTAIPTTTDTKDVMIEPIFFNVLYFQVKSIYGIKVSTYKPFAVVVVCIGAVHK